MRRRLIRGGVLAVLALAALWEPAAARAEDAGRAVFTRQCLACHSVVRMQNRVGPSLYGVVGRAAGAVSSYIYSAALRASGLVWTEPVLEAFLADPQALIPGSAMRYAGLKDAADRAALIAYLKGL
ncbi:MAG: c-type cytochrome [Rhodospirillaceae bacterium]